MRLSREGEAMVGSARERILVALEEDGALPVGALPRRWPESRLLIRHLLDELASAGEVEPGRPVYGRPTFRITPRGRGRLRGLDMAGD